MKNLAFRVAPLLFAAMFVRASATTDALIWNKDNAFAGWQGVNCSAAVVGDNFVLTDIKYDPQILIAPVAIDYARVNTITYTYRAANRPESAGQLYFASSKDQFSDQARWRLPALKADGAWHTVTVPASTDCMASGVVSRLRFDITDQAGGKIEIKELKFGFDKKLSAKLKPFPKVETLLDAPKWPALTPEFLAKDPEVSGEPYFTGKMIRAPQDQRGTTAYKTFFLRKEFTLKAKPAFAYLQYAADDGAGAYVNGTLISALSDWKVPRQNEVTDKLQAGKNVLAFRYDNAESAGGVLAELYVGYGDGTSEKIDTDGTFLAGVQASAGWNAPGFASGDWMPAVEQLPPPAQPWMIKLAYCNFSCPQQVLCGKVTPEVANAGEKVSLRFEFAGRMPEFPAKFQLALMKNKVEIWREELTLDAACARASGEGRWVLEFAYELPHYLRSADLTVRLASGFIFCKPDNMPEAKFTYRELERAPGYEKVMTSKVVQGANGPVMLVNDQPFFPVWAWVNARARPDKTYRFGSAPVNMVTIIGGQEWWPKCGEFVPEALDRLAERHRRDYGADVLFMWDLSLYPPPDWAEKYPGEMAIDDHGAVNKDGRGSNHSFASKRALKDMRETMLKAIDYLEKTPYANRIVGYRINGGHTIEWLGWDPKPGRILDFSPAAQTAFVAFAKANYPQLKDYAIPSLAERRELDDEEILWEPAKHLKTIAYHDFYSHAIADMVLDLCRTAKTRLAGRKVVGTYYGYTMTLHSPGQSQMRANYALKKVLDSQAVDFLISPPSYSVRNLGDTCADMKPFESIRRHGILSVVEDDTRTHNGPYILVSNNYQMPTKATTLASMRRNAAIALARNNPLSYYAICNGTDFDFPEMAEDVASLRKLGEHCIAKAVPRAAEVAIVVSEEAIKAMPMYHRLIAPTGYYLQRYQKDGSVKCERAVNTILTGTSFTTELTNYARMGAPCDYLLAEDLADNPGDYKLYVFVNAFKYDAKFLAAVNKLKERNCTLFWVYAPGYVTGDKAAAENMRALTGFDLVKASCPMMPAVKLANGEWLGTPTTRIAPLFAVRPSAEIKALGAYEDGSIGYAQKETGVSRSVFCGAYQFNVPFLTELARSSGAHVYSDSSDPIEANASLFSLHARFPGKKTLRLPRAADVVDVINKKLVARNVESFTFDAPLHTTWIFYYGDDAEALLKKLKN